MTSTFKIKFWWALRNFWHMPHFWLDSSRPKTFWSKETYGSEDTVTVWEISYYYHFIKYYRHYTLKQNWTLFRGLFGSHMRALWKRIKYPHYWIGLRCNGDKGGWRTRLCDWLEMKARTAEDKFASSSKIE